MSNTKSTIAFMLNNVPQNILTLEEEIALGTKVQLGLKAEREKQYIDMFLFNKSVEFDEDTEDDDEEVDKKLLKLRTELENEFHDNPPSMEPDAIKRREQLIEEGHQAQMEFVIHNVKLVVSISKKKEGYHMERADLIQEGIIGCMVAARKYDPTRGLRFSTCAVPWIEQQMNRGIQRQNRQIYLPMHVYAALSRIKKIEEAYAQEHDGAMPTDEQIAELSDGKLTVKNIQLYRQNSQPIPSLNTVVGEEDDTELGDLIEDDEDLSPTEYANRTDLYELLEQQIDKLPKIQAEIMRLRYGFNEKRQQYTLEQVGDKLGYTRERIRQYETDAILRLRVACRQLGLEDLLK